MFIVKRKSDGKWLNRSYYRSGEEKWVECIEDARPYKTIAAAKSSLNIDGPTCAWHLEYPNGMEYGKENLRLPKPSKREIKAELQRQLAKYELYEVKLGVNICKVNWQ
jgi:hypothetical protein